MGYIKVFELKKAIETGNPLTIQQAAALVGDNSINSQSSARTWLETIMRECSMVGTNFVILPDGREPENVNHYSTLRVVHLHHENDNMNFKLYLLNLLIEFGSTVWRIADYARLIDRVDLQTGQQAEAWVQRYLDAINEIKPEFALVRPLQPSPVSYLGALHVNRVKPTPLSDVDGSKPGNSSRDSVGNLLQARNAKYGNSYYATDRAIMAMIEGDASNLQGLLDAGILANWVIIMSKMNRAIWSPTEPDHYQDIAGYCSLIAKILSGEPPKEIQDH